MPELPDVQVYLEALESRILGARLERVRIQSPFLLRSVDPPIDQAAGKSVRALRRLGKRIVLGLDDDLFLVIHLMIAGRLRWQDSPAGARSSESGARRSSRRPPNSEFRKPPKSNLAMFQFSTGTLLLTEAGSKRRASLHLVRGSSGLAAHDPGGLEVLEAPLQQFRLALRNESHTLKRALTDPRILSGIGNAYSDEILHAAGLSPLKRTRQLDQDETERLYRATQETLRRWIARLREERGGGFPTNVTAFRDGMAVHGRFRKPCPVCGSPVQRVVYAQHEMNYCARCQTGGKLLADRALSRLLKGDWPRSLEELEERFTPPASGC